MMIFPRTEGLINRGYHYGSTMLYRWSTYLSTSALMNRLHICFSSVVLQLLFFPKVVSPKCFEDKANWGYTVTFVIKFCCQVSFIHVALGQHMPPFTLTPSVWKKETSRWKNTRKSSKILSFSQVLPKKSRAAGPHNLLSTKVWKKTDYIQYYMQRQNSRKFFTQREKRQ